MSQSGRRQTIWEARLDDLLKNGDYGDGPRATPTVDSGLVYALGAQRGLICLKPAWGNRLGRPTY